MTVPDHWHLDICGPVAIDGHLLYCLSGSSGQRLQNRVRWRISGITHGLSLVSAVEKAGLPIRGQYAR